MQQALLDAVVEATGRAVVFADAQGLITYLNPAAAQFFGCAREQMLGITFDSLIADADGEDPKSDFRQLASKDDRASESATVQIRAGDGAVAEANIRIVAHQDDSCFVATFQQGENQSRHQSDDVVSTQRKQIQEELRRAHEALQLQVEQRTAELTRLNRELREDNIRREEVESELRRQKDLLSHILSSIPHFVFWKDRDSVYQGCNERFARIGGLERAEDIAGKTDYDLAWKEQAEWYRKCDQDVMDSGEPMMNIEEPQTRSDGTETVILTSKVPLRDEDGSVCGVLGIYADITQRKQAEKLIADMARFPKENPCPVFRVSREGTLSFANEPSLRLLASRGAAEGEAAPEQWRQLAQRAMDSDTVVETEIKEGDVVFAFQVVPIVEAGYANFYGSDVTQIKAAQRKSEETSNFLTTILESLNHPFYVIDADSYEVGVCNSAAGRGGSGKQCYQLTHDRESPCDGDHMCPLSEVKNTRRPVTVEHVHRNENGEFCCVEVRAHPLFDADGNVSQVIEYSLDITERKEAEKKLLQSVEDVERFNRLAVGRELRMVELKQEVNALLEQLGREAKYNPGTPSKPDQVEEDASVAEPPCTATAGIQSGDESDAK